jgi:hypothetical protein
MDKATLTNLISASNGKFFTIKFRKANGDIRVANGKDFYKRLLSGGTSTLSESNSKPFVDRNKGHFISANAERVIGFKCGSLTYPNSG